ncbi:hypothetical protein ACH5RR_014465 [Cinchona calisaya]|uniref:Uncharacterized protein n=1 Tax=Cinchona calisaya TaxID=153742 RepID=A0ABD3A3I9_9GENT
MQSLLNSWWLWGLGGVFEPVGKVARSLNHEWSFGVSIAEYQYVEDSATLASSLYNQVLNLNFLSLIHYLKITVGYLQPFLLLKEFFFHFFFPGFLSVYK